MTVAIHKNISETNSCQNSPGLIAYYVHTPNDGRGLIKIDFQIIQMPRVAKRLVQFLEHLPLIAQFSFPRGIYEVIGENAVELCDHVQSMLLANHLQCAEAFVHLLPA